MEFESAETQFATQSSHATNPSSDWLWLVDGRDPKHDVESRRKFSDSRSLDGDEVHEHRLTSFLVAETAKNAVLLVARMALHVTLRDKFLLARDFDCNVNMRRATGIRHGLDRAKAILTRASREETAEALEMLVAFVGVTSLRQPVEIDLPAVWLAEL